MSRKNNRLISLEEQEQIKAENRRREAERGYQVALIVGDDGDLRQVRIPVGG